ncbi:hypothetical protein OSTOST_11972, partial [Ostertagia ostertagi]
ANVDSQWSLSNLQKFNYLITALRGDARELIKRYPVTGENYALAIDLLKKKYGNTSRLITALQARLDHAKAEQSSVQAQRALLETITPIVIQLQKLGVVLDGSYNAQKVLAKFAVRIQRKVLEHIVTPEMEESRWNMTTIIETIDAHISTEEQINEMVSKRDIATDKSAMMGTRNSLVTRKAYMNTLDELQRLRRIFEAIPPLPDATTLYNKILHGSIQLRITTRSMSDLFERIRTLQNSQESLRDRSLQLQIIEALCEKMHMAFMAIFIAKIGTPYAFNP